MDYQTSLTKKEKRELKRLKKMDTQVTMVKKQYRMMGMRWAVLIFVALSIGGLVWFGATRPPVPESEVVSLNGLHWHPELAIYVKGEKQEIPANIGIGAVHQPIHTHAEDSDKGILHLEFSGLVRKQDLRLGQFFINWGKEIRSFGTNMKMTVNGEGNTEYDNYVMRERDKIELHFD